MDYICEDIGTNWPVKCLSEFTLVQELIYVFQGIDGNYLKLSPVTGQYELQGYAKQTHHTLVLRMAELGWLHNQVRNFCESPQRDYTQRCLAHTLRGYLVDYYYCISILQALILNPLENSQDPALHALVPFSAQIPFPETERLTLLKLLVWIEEPLKRFKILVAMIVSCHNLKGGQLASCVHNFMHHGDTLVSETARKILKNVCKPMFEMMWRWMLYGILEDPYEEFFITEISCASSGWSADRYTVIEELVPSFISLQEARKILWTGKNVHLLREFSLGDTSHEMRQNIKKAMESIDFESVMSVKESLITSVLNLAYRETSLRLVNSLNLLHDLPFHFYALRNYLLLGKGEVIRYLMMLVDNELNEPADSVNINKLSNSLQKAITQTTDAQEYDKVIGKVHVFLLNSSADDIGWDIFSLNYRIDNKSPLKHILKPNLPVYLAVFHVLWRAKRMEYILLQMWMTLMKSSRHNRRTSLKYVHVLTTEMLRLVYQLQFYMLFEKIECLWQAFWNNICKAESLEDIIDSHEDFLKAVQYGVFLDKGTRKFAVRISLIFGYILRLEQIVDQIQSSNREINDSLTSEENLIEACTDLRCMFEDAIRKFLHSLNKETDLSVHLLSYRLNFNDYYNTHVQDICVSYKAVTSNKQLFLPPAVFTILSEKRNVLETQSCK